MSITYNTKAGGSQISKSTFARWAMPARQPYSDNGIIYLLEVVSRDIVSQHTVKKNSCICLFYNRTFTILYDYLAWLN